MASTSRTSLDAKHRSHRWFANDAGGGLADATEGLSEANGRDCFPFAKWSRVDRGDQHKAPLRLREPVFECLPCYFSNTVSHWRQFMGRDA